MYPLFTDRFNVVSTGEIKSSSSDTCKGVTEKAGPNMAGSISSCVFIIKVVLAVQ